VTVTRKDVARLAGTSPAVVSYVLNGGPRGVAAETKERVLAAVQTLGYRPNQIGAALRRNRTMTLGLVIPDNANPFFAVLARAVEDAAFAAGYTLLLGNATDSEERQTRYIRTFVDQRVDGVILIPSHDHVAAQNELRNTPWIILDRRLDGAPTNQLIVDHRGGSRMATDHLIGHGRQRIACIAGPNDVSVARDRVEGWRDALTEAELEGPAREMRVPFGRYAGYHATLRLMAAHPDVDAIFAASDEQAVGAMRALAELGIRCPDDVALASFDGIPASAYAIPALTTVRQPIEELGRRSIEMLLDRIEDPEADLETVLLPPTLVVRGSCGCADPPGGEHPEPTDLQQDDPERDDPERDDPERDDPEQDDLQRDQTGAAE
jgi:LacI family transcriptional regulator